MVGMIDLKPACVEMIDLLQGVTDDQLTWPSPCAAYSAGDLIDHIDQVSEQFTALAAKVNGSQSAVTPSSSHLGATWRIGVARHIRALGAAWDDPAAWSGNPGLPALDLPSEVWGKIALTEMVVHGWDVAQATKQFFDLPEQTLRACFDHVREFVPSAPVPELWGPTTHADDDATLLERIVAITGRQP
jgi:uncharacterized protein (TIGR03086 family)